MKIAFVHPDLGIGGAERLVVDCALALQKQGHDVIIYTSHHDPSHAFDETRDGTLKVQVLGNSLFPRHFAGRLAILGAILRQLHLVVTLAAQHAEVDVFFVDQLSACVPYLRCFFPSSRILFYCHHPDLLLTNRASLLKKLYRLPFDSFERWSTAKSDRIAVNSEYTRKVFFETFGKEMPDPDVVYPIVDASQTVIDKQSLDPEALNKLAPYLGSASTDGVQPRMVLSINRFERKKDIELALTSFSLLMHADTASRVHLLVIAGGYDERVPENIEYLKELQALAKKFRMPSATIMPSDTWSALDLEQTRVLFLPSVSSSLRDLLLTHAAALLYTPTNEHFGIVPLEAMHAETPVLATNTGGPLETIVDGVTGWLRAPDVDDWFPVVKFVLMQAKQEDLRRMGRQGRERVIEKFSMTTLEPLLNTLVLKTLETERKNEVAVTRNTKQVTIGVFVAGILALIVFFVAVRWLYIVAKMFYEVAKNFP